MGCISWMNAPLSVYCLDNNGRLGNVAASECGVPAAGRTLTGLAHLRIFAPMRPAPTGRHRWMRTLHTGRILFAFTGSDVLVKRSRQDRFMPIAPTAAAHLYELSELKRTL
jgi:hypothetical protein